MATPIKNVEARLNSFVNGLSGAERIDDLVLTPEQQKARKADFFFENRRIICELKTLLQDTATKIPGVLAPHEKRPDWPVFYGQQGLSETLANLSDGEVVKREVLNAVTTAVAKAIREANGQIRDTKCQFELPNSGGMLILVNERIDVLSPSILGWKVREMLNKRTPAGGSQFPEVNVVWIINESHTTQLSPELQGIPGLVTTNLLVADHAGAETYVDSLQEKWATFLGIPLVVVSGADLNDLVFESATKPRPAAGQSVPRQQFWRDQYRANRYLAHLSEQQLLRHAQRLFAEIVPRGLKGVTEAQGRRFQDGMEPFTHFLTEANLRGLDMRKIRPFLQPLGAKLQAGESLDVFSKVGRNDLCPCRSGKKYKRCCAK